MMRTIVERFVEQSPMTIMARLVLQCALHDDWIGAAADAGDGRRRVDPRGAVCPRRRRDRIDCRVAADAGCRRGRCAGLGSAVTALHDCMSRWRAGWGVPARDSVELLLPVASVHNADGAHAVDGMRLRVLDGSGEACVPQAGGCDCGRACDDPARDGAAVRSCRSTIRNSG